jgi:hypothetical protein
MIGKLGEEPGGFADQGERLPGFLHLMAGVTDGLINAQ